jgi:hippurate hydrolase
VIPPQAVQRSTVRTFRPEVQAATEASMARVVQGVRAACGATGTLRYERHYPATVNAARYTDWSAAAAGDVAGAANVDRDTRPCMGARTSPSCCNGAGYWARLVERLLG